MQLVVSNLEDMVTVGALEKQVEAMGAAREEMYFREQDEKKLKELGEKHQNKSNNYSSEKTNETK